MKKKIVFTGPESSGKTTLCKALATHYNTTWVKEYARTYLTLLDRPYNYKDLFHIIEEQIKAENNRIQEGHPFLFCDTGLLVLKIWSEVKFNRCPIILGHQLQQQAYDLFVLCSPDIPWIYDPLRENPTNRMELFELYLQDLELLQLPYIIVTGNHEQRLQTTVAAIEKLT